ncbi:acetylpolyamine aminohydrolase [bacterium BMS3Bbin08]|nr:acetylpolyamine aminohydrolase [bacterium BMS3Bbin08]
MKIFFSEKCLEYSQPGHPESPARVSSTYRFLKEKGLEFIEPAPCGDEDILLAHTPELLNAVKGESFFDMDTPALPGIFEHARLAAGSAIDAARQCLKGEMTFSLMRPPGHHATGNRLGGFCYFNNIAIAVLKIKEQAGESDRPGKIAIIDFDCHHGNGTEDIFLNRNDFLYVSLHQSPLYPGTGLSSRGNCVNYPLPADTSPDEYLAVLGKALKKVAEFGADLLAVSAGFDTYRLDPITNISLEKDTYKEIGEMLSKPGLPLFAVLEGGYSRDIPECIYQFLTGLEKKGGKT